MTQKVLPFLLSANSSAAVTTELAAALNIDVDERGLIEDHDVEPTLSRLPRWIDDEPVARLFSPQKNDDALSVIELAWQDHIGPAWHVFTVLTQAGHL